MPTLFDDDPICADVGSTDKDSFQTPPIALLPILPYLTPFRYLWEPACGDGNIVRTLIAEGFCTFGTDILRGQDFLTCPVPAGVQAIITNPPYSLSDEFLAHAYMLGLPFAFLLPVACIGGQTRQNLYRENGVEIVMLGRRINFKTPTGKEDGRGSSATFETCWVTNGLGIGSPLTFYQLPKVQAVLFGGHAPASGVIGRCNAMAGRALNDG